MLACISVWLRKVRSVGNRRAAKKLRHERHGLGRGKIRIPEDAVEDYRRSVTVEATVNTGPEAAVAPPRARLHLKHLKL